MRFVGRHTISAISHNFLAAIRGEWTHWGLNPGPSACGADVIPLHHVPDDYKAMSLNHNIRKPL